MFTIKPESKISFSINYPFFIIKLNNPQTLNSMSYDDFLYITRLLEIAENNNEIYFTILQSSGTFFSSGADFNTISNNPSGDDSYELRLWLEQFLSKNQYITSSFINHSKILIACLNGSAIGLSAAIVLLCDMVYAMDTKSETNFLQFPFARLGLSCEGATSITLPTKIGWNKSFSKLIFGEKLYFHEILNTVIVKDYSMGLDPLSVDTFNNQVIRDLKTKIKPLYLPACLQMKTVLRASNDTVNTLMLANSNEVHGALPFWRNGEPQRRFALLRDKKISAKKSRIDKSKL